jgi:hypothetical protein
VKTITLCGSTRFKDQFQQTERRLALEGYAVYSCSLWGHSDDPLTEDQKLMLDAVHQVKIMNSECIMVINVGGYVGESTKREIMLADNLGKKITFLEHHHPFAQKWTR